MSITSNTVSALYATLFNRAPEGAGHAFWLNAANKQNLSVEQLTHQMLQTKASKDYFAGKESNFEFINHIYKNLFNKTSADDPQGVRFWTDKLDKGISKATIVSELIKAATQGVFSKPEDVKAQKLFLNKVKAAELTSKVIENISDKGSLADKIAGFQAILKNIKDSSTPTQIAQVIKQEALKNNLKIADDKKIAEIVKSLFPSWDKAAVEQALNNTTASTDIYAPNPGGNGQGGGSGGGGAQPPHTPQQQKEQAVKKAQDALNAALKAAQDAKTDKLAANYTKEALEKAAENSNIKSYGLQYLDKKLSESSVTDEQRAALNKAKDNLNKISGKIIDKKNLVDAQGKANVADKAGNLADKQVLLAKAELSFAQADAKKESVDQIYNKAAADNNAAVSAKEVAEELKNLINDTAKNTIQEIANGIDGTSLKPAQKEMAKAQLKQWAKELGLGDTDNKNDALKNKADAYEKDTKNKAGAAEKAFNDADEAKKANDKVLTGADVAAAKSDVAKALLELKQAQVTAAQNNLKEDANNPDLKAALAKAEAELQKAKADALADLAKKLGAVELKQVGDTTLYRSADGKYSVDIGKKIEKDKTLVVDKTTNKLHEIGTDSTSLGEAKFTDKALLRSDAGNKITLFKNGEKQITYIEKDGKVVSAINKEGTKAYFLKNADVAADYDTLSKGAFEGDKLKIGGNEKEGYEAQISQDGNKFKVDKVKVSGTDYTFDNANRPAIDEITDYKVKDLSGLKIPLINGKVYNGTKDGYKIKSDSQSGIGNLDSVEEGNTVYKFNADYKVTSIKDGNYTYVLKSSVDFGNARNGLNTQEKRVKESSKILDQDGNEFILNNESKIEKINLKNGAELTLKDPAAFNSATLNDLKINNIKFKDTNFKLTGEHKYGEAKTYEKVDGKNLLKAGNKYINTEAEKDGLKHTVTNAEENKYTLTVTKGAAKVSEEKLENGITKLTTYGDNGTDVKDVTISGTSANPNDTVDVVNSNEDNTGKVLASNLEKTQFKSIEKFNINAAVSNLSFKQFEKMNGADTKEISLGAASTTISDAKGNIDLSKVKYNNKKLSMDISGNNTKDTIKLSGDKGELSLNGFNAADDKIDFSNLGATDKTVTSANSPETTIENGKIYKTTVGGNINDNIFDQLFAASGKTFKTTVTKNAKSVIAVKGSDKTKLYSVEDKDGSGTIDQSEVSLVGTLDGSVELNNSNIA